MSKKLEALKVIAEGFAMLYKAQEELEQDVKVVSAEKPIPEEKPVEKSEPVKEEKTSNEKSVPVADKKEDVKSVKPKKAEEKISAPKEEVKEEPVEKEKDSDDLDSMTDTELKALAKDMGIRITFGMKRQRILDAVREKIKEEKLKEETEKKSAEKESEELPEDSLMKRLREETEDMTDDEIRELLSEAEISEKGGRTALLAKLYEAVKSGVIKIDEEEEADESDGEDALISDEDDEEEEEDTPERIKAIKVFDKENRDAFEKGQLEVGDMKSFLKENFDITMPKKATPAEVLDKYIECAANFIDDDGNTVEEGAYLVRGVPHCCGVPLKLSKDKSGKAIGECSICGEKYEIDEDK